MLEKIVKARETIKKVTETGNCGNKAFRVGNDTHLSARPSYHCKAQDACEVQIEISIY